MTTKSRIASAMPVAGAGLGLGASAISLAEHMTVLTLYMLGAGLPADVATSATFVLSALWTLLLTIAGALLARFLAPLLLPAHHLPERQPIEPVPADPATRNEGEGR